MEVAETLKSLQDLLEDADYQTTRAHILECHSEYADKVDRIIENLREEDEFALLCRLMGTCTSIVRLDQKHVVPGSYSVPDFLASFSPGCTICSIEPNSDKPFQCFIDVKSCSSESVKKIGAGELKRLRNYVRNFGLPLLFAVRFTKAEDFEFWVIVEDNDQTANELKISPGQYCNGVRQVLWDESFFQVKPGIKLKATYSTLKKNSPLRHPDYGFLSHLTINNEEKELALYEIAAAACHIFFSLPGVLKNQRTENLGAFTINYAETVGDPDNPYFWSTADVIRAFNSKIINRSGVAGYPASQVLLPKGKSGSPLIDKVWVNQLLEPLAQIGVVTFVGHGTQANHQELCARFNRTQSGIENT